MAVAGELGNSQRPLWNLSLFFFFFETFFVLVLDFLFCFVFFARRECAKLNHWEMGKGGKPTHEVRGRSMQPCPGVLVGS